MLPILKKPILKIEIKLFFQIKAQPVNLKIILTSHWKLKISKKKLNLPVDLQSMICTLMKRIPIFKMKDFKATNPEGLMNKIKSTIKLKMKINLIL